MMAQVGTLYPISALRFLAGRTHVCTPLAEIEANIRERAEKSGNQLWTAHKIHRCAQHIKAQLNQHRRVIRSVGL